jgi:hypothetical protein
VLVISFHSLHTYRLQNGSSAKDIAVQLKFEEIIDALESKINLEKGKCTNVVSTKLALHTDDSFVVYDTYSDPTLPKFRQWLNSLGGGEYLFKFVNAGYDLTFIAKHGLEDRDLDCVGIPTSKMGLRRKIMSLHELSKFYAEEENENEEESEEEEEDEDEDEEEDEEDGDVEEDED